MSQELTLYPIADLLGRQFFIPSYQRGFRWGPQQVTDLLDDLYAFAQKVKPLGEFYCLQPIVVRRHAWQMQVEGVEADGWEVVDGQQRLTTIRILLEFLITHHLRGATLQAEYGKGVYGIYYETRVDSERFLSNIREDAPEDIDLYHMGRAYTTIHQWFEKQEVPRDARESVLRTLVYSSEQQKPEGIAQIIWYELDESENPIDSFVRINLGKIPLTNAELIKALFLQKSNFGAEQNELGRLRQLEIANEWDEIENTLQQPLFWEFLSRNNGKTSSRIELLLDLLREVAVQNDPSLKPLIGTDEHATFRYFYNLLGTQANFKTMKGTWEKIRRCFRTMQEWYNNAEWYHYIGFLIAVSGTTLASIYNRLRDKDVTTKIDISKKLKSIIRALLTGVKWEYDGNTKEYFLNVSYSKTDKEKVRQILLLFNIQSVVNQCKANALVLKFPFKAYKGMRDTKGWDVEHIDSATKNELRSKEMRDEWLTNSRADLRDKLIGKDFLNERIQKFLDADKAEGFDELAKDIGILAGEKEVSDEMKDNIGNLALLDAGTNRAYGNALFTTKRRTIINNDKAGIFIPLCTKNVFLKYYDRVGNAPSSWTDADMRNYRRAIASELSEFLPVKPSQTINHA